MNLILIRTFEQMDRWKKSLLDQKYTLFVSNLHARLQAPEEASSTLLERRFNSSKQKKFLRFFCPV
jgi:hypothetical protein